MMESVLAFAQWMAFWMLVVIFAHNVLWEIWLAVGKDPHALAEYRAKLILREDGSTARRISSLLAAAMWAYALVRWLR